MTSEIESPTRRAMVEAIRSAVEQSGMNQRRIAERAGLSEKALSTILNGKSWSSPEVLDDIFAVCRVDMAITVKPKTD